MWCCMKDKQGRDVVDGKEHGYGVLTYDDGTVHRGEFKNGKIDGYGEIKWADGDTYKGQFIHGIIWQININFYT